MSVARSIIPLVLIALAGVPAHAATDAPDGTLLSSRPCGPNPIESYEDYWEGVRSYFNEEAANAANEGRAMPPVDDALLRASLESPEAVAAHLAYDGFECRDIRYASDGLIIAGFIWKPVDTDGRKLPLIIANRGGNSDFGPMTAWRDWGWHDFLKAGYVVMASQYRGGPGSEGSDEFGGADLDDVRALIPLAEGLGYVDKRNLFAFGGSRGGMMTFMLARGDSPLRAIGIRGGLLDLFGAAKQRPVMEERVFARLMPDYREREAALAKRSVSRWTDEVSTPTIIFHGSDDWRAKPEPAITVTQGLMDAGTPVELHLYAGDTHSMTLNRADMLRHTVRFFDRYRLPTGD